MRIYSRIVLTLATTVTYVGPVVNVAAQAYLWITFAQSLHAHQWPPGLWAIFGLGCLLSAVTLWFQVETLWKLWRNRVAVRVQRKTWFLGWAGLIGAGVSTGGNAVDLAVMWQVGVPFGDRDRVLVEIAVACFGVLMIMARRLPLLRQLERRQRIGTVLGFCGRVVVLTMAAILAFPERQLPFSTVPLVFATVVGCTLFLTFLEQWWRQNTPPNRANLYLWAAYVVALVMLWGDTAIMA
ncbi:MAG TPA: hypothetical protein VLI05_01485 [Candidatus Saccharimonadia bacterium]|nr:hypothetical protein [Candidatus Saccharimonadia bacterium]